MMAGTTPQKKCDAFLRVDQLLRIVDIDGNHLLPADSKTTTSLLNVGTMAVLDASNGEVTDCFSYRTHQERDPKYSLEFTNSQKNKETFLYFNVPKPSMKCRTMTEDVETSRTMYDSSTSVDSDKMKVENSILFERIKRNEIENKYRLEKLAYENEMMRKAMSLLSQPTFQAEVRADNRNPSTVAATSNTLHQMRCITKSSNLTELSCAPYQQCPGDTTNTLRFPDSSRRLSSSNRPTFKICSASHIGQKRTYDVSSDTVGSWSISSKQYNKQRSIGSLAII